MNGADILVLVIVSALAGAAILKILRNKKSGSGGCGCDCYGCAHRCGKNRAEKRRTLLRNQLDK